ncbi:unnamed protein product [Cuscuta epithymum]|uniref:Uncharacterized protein n=1 Tax=Cuscuta epithymum TaxID=186058 RepID=A0AAV0E732_9ASTE|nr:unnamed protein product [Cuscuta epithymum]
MASHPGGAAMASHPGGAAMASHPGGAAMASHPGGAAMASHPGGAALASHPGRAARDSIVAVHLGGGRRLVCETGDGWSELGPGRCRIGSWLLGSGAAEGAGQGVGLWCGWV